MGYYCGVLVEIRGLRYRGETGWELIFSTGEEGKGKGLRPQGSKQIKMPSKGRTRQAHVKCQDASGGPDRRAKWEIRFASARDIWDRRDGRSFGVRW
jgi:hypothetical protein